MCMWVTLRDFIQHSIVALVCATFILFTYVLANGENTTVSVLVKASKSKSVPASQPASSIDDVREQELSSLLQSGWWRGNYIYNTSHCNWHGVTCNIAGRVTEISLRDLNYGMEEVALQKLNLSSLPNLTRLSLRRIGLKGTIPSEIGSLSKLTHLDLSWNDLTGELPPSLAKLSRLVLLDLYLNEISGSIP